MLLLPEMSNPYFEALTIILLYGLVFCTSTCRPYVAGYIAGIGAGFRKGTMVTLIFSSDRLTAYALIGGLVGLFSWAFGFLLNQSVFAYSAVFFVCFWRSNHSYWHQYTLQEQISYLQPRISKHENVGRAKMNREFDARAFSLDLDRSLIVCPPLVMLFVYSVPFATPIDSLIGAVLFGLETNLSPLLIRGGVTGWLLNKAPFFRKGVSIAGAAILIVLGISIVVNAISVERP